MANYFDGNTAIASTSNSAPGRASCGTPIVVLAGGADLFTYFDRKNPQLAARLLSALKNWRVLEPSRRAQAEAALRRVAAPSRSRDVGDIAQRALAEE